MKDNIANKYLYDGWSVYFRPICEHKIEKSEIVNGIKFLRCTECKTVRRAK